MSCLGWMVYQDWKERKIFLFLFPVLGFLLFSVFYLESSIPSVLYYNVLLNLVLVGILILIAFLFTRFFTQRKFLDHSLGLGDIFFFICIAIGFPTITFSILLSCSLLFSLLVFMAIKTKLEMKTVPLAGLMAFFFMLIVGSTLIFGEPSLYTL